MDSSNVFPTPAGPGRVPLAKNGHFARRPAEGNSQKLRQSFGKTQPFHDCSQAGEQYFLDLGGNIKKGPTSKSSSCYCGPAFQKFEKKLEKDKQVLDLKPQWLFVHGLHVVHLQELLKHIDNSHSKLDNKISHLERKTRDQLFNLNQTMKESFASERFDSLSQCQI